jgi:hypothetical protein
MKEGKKPSAGSMRIRSSYFEERPDSLFLDLVLAVEWILTRS